MAIKVWRKEIEQEPLTGFVAEIGAEYLAMELVSDFIRPNGFTFFRIADITGCEVPDPYNDFLKDALRLKGFERLKSPDVDLTSTRTVLQSAGAISPLITIHSEIADPHVCFIGELISISKDEVSLRCITPAATWEEEHESYPLKHITRIDIQGEYEEALLLVANSKKK